MQTTQQNRRKHLTSPALDKCIASAAELLSMVEQLSPDDQRALLLHRSVTKLWRMGNKLIDTDHEEARRLLVA